MGVRARWDQMGWQDKRLWVIGGDGAMLDIGFSSLSRMLSSGLDIKVLVLDTQVYSNTGGQSSTGTFRGQGTKMSPFGKVEWGKSEARKEVANIAMMHPNVYVAQTTAAHMNHFYRAVMEANSYPGPALISCLHHLPAGARRRRSRGDAARPRRGRQPRLPADDPRPAQGRDLPRAARRRWSSSWRNPPIQIGG
jgi:pyruvate/2-oxoacid:ferredoxin oxidoreductase beta subunit